VLSLQPLQKPERTLNPLKQYNIGFVGLSIGTHNYSFDIGPEFFLHFGEAAFEHGLVVLNFDLEKSNNIITLHFQFKGEVSLSCDRCMEMYQQPFDLKKQILVKFGDGYMEQSDEIIIIPYTASHIDISQFVYEFLHLGLPLRRVHPDMADGNYGCDPKVVESLKKYQVKHKQAFDNVDDTPWKALKRLKFN
jgi:uncharacterized protein